LRLAACLKRAPGDGVQAHEAVECLPDPGEQLRLAWPRQLRARTCEVGPERRHRGKEGRPAGAVVVAVRRLPAVEVGDVELELESESPVVSSRLHGVEAIAQARERPDADAGCHRQPGDRDDERRIQLRTDGHGGDTPASSSRRRRAGQSLVLVCTPRAPTIARATTVTTRSASGTWRPTTMPA